MAHSRLKSLRPVLTKTLASWERWRCMKGLFNRASWCLFGKIVHRRRLQNLSCFTLKNTKMSLKSARFLALHTSDFCKPRFSLPLPLRALRR
jgi:hypothetical protein